MEDAGQEEARDDNVQHTERRRHVQVTERVLARGVFGQSQETGNLGSVRAEYATARVALSEFSAWPEACVYFYSDVAFGLTTRLALGLMSASIQMLISG